MNSLKTATNFLSIEFFVDYLYRIFYINLNN